MTTPNKFEDKPEPVTNSKQFNNQSLTKINLDEYNFSTNDNRNPNDWLANAIFCLDLEDRVKNWTTETKRSAHAST